MSRFRYTVLSGIEDVIGVIQDVLTFGVWTFRYTQSIMTLRYISICLTVTASLLGYKHTYIQT